MSTHGIDMSPLTIHSSQSLVIHRQVECILVVCFSFACGFLQILEAYPLHAVATINVADEIVDIIVSSAIALLRLTIVMMTILTRHREPRLSYNIYLAARGGGGRIQFDCPLCLFGATTYILYIHIYTYFCYTNHWNHLYTTGRGAL